MKGNLADFILENYYKEVYPKELGSKRLVLPERFKGGSYSRCKTYKSLAKTLVGTASNSSDYLLEQLHKLALLEHKPSVVSTCVTTSFPPCEGLVLSAYALKYFGDTHALDRGTSLRSRLDNYLEATFGFMDLSCIGIVETEVTSTVWSYKVVEGFGFVGTSLFDTGSIPLKVHSTSIVWIFENENTAQRVLSNDLQFPFIIASGRPTKAFHSLVERLLREGVTLYYHGDMDLAGIDIFDKLHKRYPQILAPFMTVAEFKISSSVSFPKKQHFNLVNTYLPELVSHIRDTGSVVYEEQLDLTKCLSFYSCQNP